MFTYCHSKGAKEETPSDSGDGLKLDADLPECRIEKFVANRDEDDNGDWVDILHNVVRYSMKLHGASLSDEVIQHLLRTLLAHETIKWIEDK